MKIKYSESEDTEMIKIFDYTFDYILVKLETVSLQYIVDLTNINIHTIQTILERTGYKLYHQDNECFVTDFPVHSPIIIEIMTSSTSGGNKKYRSTIPLAFEDALLKIHHNGPGINYRQVWARMVSQLIVKSEVGLAWNGSTIWVVQENLVEYISRSTALNLYYFENTTLADVNILSLTYSDSNTTNQPEMLKKVGFYSGPI